MREQTKDRKCKRGEISKSVEGKADVRGGRREGGTGSCLKRLNGVRDIRTADAASLQLRAAFDAHGYMRAR